MKKNSGSCYEFYKEWKTALDVAAPISLGLVGMLIGFYVKRKLFMLGIDESVSSGAMATLTAAPVAIYNKVINNYASKIQEDLDFDELEKKDKLILSIRRKAAKDKKLIADLKDGKIKAYQAHKKTAEKIQRILNQPHVEHSLRLEICDLIYAGDGDVFSLTVSSQDIEINEETLKDQSDRRAPRSTPIRYSSQPDISPEDIN